MTLKGFLMCFDNDSMPPIFTQAKTQVHSVSLTLKSADGSSFSAFLAKPARPSGEGIIVLPDMRGLYAFYEDVAVRLAEQGHAAIVLDYFGRTADTGPRDGNFPFMKHIFQVSRKTISDDILAAANHLRTIDGVATRGMFALGFCFGGRQAFFASAAHFQLNGVIGFYGAPGLYPNGAAGPTQHSAELSAPILAIFGGADVGIPGTDVAAFDEALTKASIQHEIITYPNAPHSFFDVKYKEHAEACADAWQRTLNFIAGHQTNPE
jgi:carboxymethylenebutenolidase